jgi:hypothetical protein
MSPRVRRLVVPFALLVLTVCSKKTTPAPEPAAARDDSRTELTPAAATEAAGEVLPAQARFSEATFDLTLRGKSSYKAGTAGEAEILLEAKGPFKPNDKYPYKFKLEPAGGLKFPAPVVGKDAIKLEGKRATMAISFTPLEAGKKKLAGQFAFSVCTDDKCLIEKRNLALEIQVD